LPPPPAARAARKILLVDANRETRAAAAAHLRAEGYAVRTAGDGLEALYALDRELPDLVVLDLELPVVSGFRVLHLLKRAHPGETPLPVLVRTALSFDEAREAACDGAEDIAPRSLPPAELVGRVRRLLDRRSLPHTARGRLLAAVGA
jgi:DNA-binding response OmpR family regulator